MGRPDIEASFERAISTMQEYRQGAITAGCLSLAADYRIVIDDLMMQLRKVREINRILATWWTKQEASTAKPAIPGLTTVASERFIAPLDGVHGDE